MNGSDDRWHLIEELLFNLQPKVDELHQQVVQMHLGYLNDIHRPHDVIPDEDPRIRQYFELNLFLSMHQQIQKRLLEALAICGAAHKGHGDQLRSAKDKVQEQLDNYRKKFDQ